MKALFVTVAFYYIRENILKYFPFDQEIHYSKIKINSKN